MTTTIISSSSSTVSIGRRSVLLCDLKRLLTQETVFLSLFFL